MPPRFQPRGRGGAPPSTVPVPSAAETHVETIGTRRKGYGQAGKPITVVTNHFACKIPEKIISHYDVVISPDEKTLPARLNFAIIHALQTKVAPNDFSPRAVYDGRKNMFAARELPFEKTKEYTVFLNDPHTADQKAKDGKEPKGYKVRLTKVAEINPEVLSRFLLGKQSNDNNVLTAITALNVVIRMQPSLDYPFNVRSFFTDNETKDIQGGLILWRGYFQSVRPASGRMLINIDISTGTMYKAGSLMNLCLDFLNKNGQPNALSTRRGLPERERIRLQRFITGIRITTNPRPGSTASQSTPRTIKKLSSLGANDLTFSLREGGQQTVAAYFQATYNKRLQYPDNLCVEVGSGALLPIEVCQVLTGQIMRKQVPPDKTKDVLDFATKKPQDRLNSITNALPVLAYGQSEYVRSFGMAVDSNGPIQIKARILPAPTLQYGRGSKQMNIVPRDGAWNMVDKKFHSPCEINAWIVVIYERQARFTAAAAQDMVQGLSRSCADVGIKIRPEPTISWQNPQGSISEQLRNAGVACKQKTGILPNLIVAVLPEGATDIYTAIKHFGDITTGVATQCLKASKCFRAKAQYYANVCLKINVKLGGINTICQPSSVPYLTDSQNPTIVMGADVVHPAPGSDGRPSFTSLVANVDSHTAKYIATSRVQTSRQEMIDDLEEMVKYVLTMYKGYREKMEKLGGTPKRIIFYRDGVSEGQFKQVLEQEVPRIKKACESLGMKPLPKLTVIVVGKRHHVRFFPKSAQEADRSGNCFAGTVVDRDVTHPTEFDFYLQSHGGLLGTSRPAHYSVLLDENDFQVDGLQQLSFALCHVYARSTRSVSIPAPVYYADIVCARAKNHYDPSAGMDLDETPTESVSLKQAQQNLDAFKSGFRPLHALAARTMYFS